MEKFISFFKNLYNNSNNSMLYIYIAGAAIAFLLIIIIIISSFKKNKKNYVKQERKQIINQEPAPTAVNKETPVISSLPVKTNKELSIQEEIKPLEDFLPEDIIKPDLDIINTLNPKQEVKVSDKDLEITQVLSATDVLSEFFLDESSNKEIPKEEEKQEEIKPLEDLLTDDIKEPVFSSVFLDTNEPDLELEPIKKEEITTKPRINLILERILSEEEIKEQKRKEAEKQKALEEAKQRELKKAKELERIKAEELAKEKEAERLADLRKKEISEPIKEVTLAKIEEPPEISDKKEIAKEESLETKTDIFSHESLIQKDNIFDPFKPKTQEELLGTSVYKEPTKTAPVVLSNEDLKEKLSKLRSKAPSLEPESQSLDDILRNIGLDEISSSSIADEENILLGR